MLIRRIARPMLASIFITGGIDQLRNASERAEPAQDFIDKALAALPAQAKTVAPSDPTTVVRINGAVMVGGGLLLATGRFPRVASGVLAGALIPTTLGAHAFWEETDPQSRATQKVQFLKNVSLLGGLIIAAADTAGKPSLAWRSKKAAATATAAVAAKLPSSSDGPSVLDKVGDVSSTVADAVSSKATQLADVTASATPTVIDGITDGLSKAGAVVSDAASGAFSNATDVIDVVSPKLAETSAKVVKRNEQLAAALKASGLEIGDAVTEKVRDRRGLFGKR